MKKEQSEQEKGLLYLFRMETWIINTIKIIKSLEDLGVLIERVTETVKHEIKQFLGVLLALLAASLAQLVFFSVVKGISGRGVRRAGRGYMDENF